eukprot:scaffold15636_cov75-Phaeocystis_antarctica.AAC.2
MMSLACQGLASCAALAISAPIAFAAAHSELNSFGSSSRSCACEAAVARAESPHALSALRSSFFCSAPAPAPCCFAGGVAAGVGRAPPASAGGGGREAGWGGLAEGLGLGLGSAAAGATSSSSSSSSSSPSSPAACTCWRRPRSKMMRIEPGLAAYSLAASWVACARDWRSRLLRRSLVATAVVAAPLRGPLRGSCSASAVTEVAAVDDIRVDCCSKDALRTGVWG